MILTTTNNVEGKIISSYLGLVCGTDIYLVGGMFGGGLGNQEHLFGAAMRNAMSNLEQHARSKGADAVVGIQTSYTSPGNINNMILALTGTAVKLKNAPESNHAEAAVNMEALVQNENPSDTEKKEAIVSSDEDMIVCPECGKKQKHNPYGCIFCHAKL